jgi:adsorption protein B
MMSHWIDILRWVLAVTAVCFLISGLDDLFVDIYYYVRQLYRRVFVAGKYTPLTEEDLRKPEEKLIAIMVPAWLEHAVIARMLEHTLRTLDYNNYEIFVGTYPNDEATMMAVASIQEQNPRVHRIVCPHEGPTNKADCLNWVMEGIRVYEKTASKKFEIFVMHDSEDIVHPLTLKLMNYLIPRIDMVQLPVTPLEVPWNSFTAGTYLDEFAEFHGKDLLVRERVARMIPSAGVGTGFSRQALDELASKTHNQLFNVETLTEDYDIGFRLRDLAKKSIILQFRIERARTVRAGLFRKREKVKRVREWVTTREFFPTRFRDAVRQKSRWIVGIVFQGWHRLGWPGGSGMRYMLWRDRKALLGNFLNMVGYVLALSVLGTYLYNSIAHPEAPHHFPVLVRKGTWMWYVVLAVTILMCHRILQRAWAVHRFAGWGQAMLSSPRLFWGNVLKWSWTGERIAWAKTDHAFPDEKQLVEFRRKLGDLLLENRLVRISQLTHALEVQKKTGELLGETLIRLGYIEEESLLSTLRMQGWTAHGNRVMLGELLLGAGLISGTQLESALRMQKQSGRRLGAVLEEMGYISRETIETYLERQSEMRTGTACPVGRA